MNKTELEALRKTLLDDEQFVQLAKYFVEKIEFYSNEDAQFRQFYTAATEAFAIENAAAVTELSQSPIEKTFLNSLILGAIKGGDLLTVHQTHKDTVAEIANFREDLASFRKFVAWFESNKPAATMEDFFEWRSRGGKWLLKSGVICPG